MMYRPVLVTPPTIKPITRTEAKAALDISYTDKDTLIDGLIAAATAHLDGWTGTLGRALCEQTWRQDYDSFGCYDPAYWRTSSYGTRLRLPLFPVISVSSVKYKDTSGVEETISSSNYTLKNDDLGAYVEFLTTFSIPSVYRESASVYATYLAGDATVTGAWSGPEAIKQAMLLLVRHWFDNPSAVIVGQTVEKVPFAVDALLAPYRRIRF